MLGRLTRPNRGHRFVVVRERLFTCVTRVAAICDRPLNDIFFVSVLRQRALRAHRVRRAHGHDRDERSAEPGTSK